MSAEEMQKYMIAQAREIERAYDEAGHPMVFEVYALLWIDTHARTFRGAWDTQQGRRAA